MSSQGAQCPPKSEVPERATGRPQGRYVAMVLLKGGDPNHRQDWSAAGGQGDIPSMAETGRQAVPGKAEKQVVVTGGGAWNTPAGARGHRSLLRARHIQRKRAWWGRGWGRMGGWDKVSRRRSCLSQLGSKDRHLLFFCFYFFATLCSVQSLRSLSRDGTRHTLTGSA